MTAKTSSTKVRSATIEKLEKELAVAKALAKEKIDENKRLSDEAVTLRAEKKAAEILRNEARRELGNEKIRADEAEQMLEKANGYIAALIEGTERKGPFHFTPACHSCGRS